MLVDRAFFFRTVRGSLFAGRLAQSQVDGLGSLLDGWEWRHAGADPRWLAYALATAYHETAQTMQPIDERGSETRFERLYGPTGQRPQRAARLGNTAAGDGARYHGRGFVQLTWKSNYLKMSEHLSAVTGDAVDLVARPELAKRLDYAVEILLHGMTAGVFTGAKLVDFFRRSASGAVVTDDWIGARRIINGSDRARTIAQHGRRFLAALRFSQECVPFAPMPPK